MKIRFLCLVLATVMLAAAFASCGETGNGNGNGNATDTSAEDTSAAPEATLLEIIKDGVSAYSIVRPDNMASNHPIVAAAVELIEEVKKLTGTTLSITTDWVMRGTTIPEYEILIGNVDREETKTVMEGLGEHNFAIRIVGKKIVIVGGNDDATVDAVSHFVKNIVPAAAADKSFVMSSEYEYDYTGTTRIRSLEILGAPILDYAIVLPKTYLISEYRTAVLLREHLAKNCGYQADITYDSAKEAHYEILIGATERSSDVPSGQTFKVKASGSKLNISASSMYAYIELQDYLKTELFDPRTKDIKIEEGFEYSRDVTDTLKDGAENVLKRSGEYRIMYNNMYGNCQDIHPRVQRQQQEYELYMQYYPDVLCLQECNPASRVGVYGIDKLLKSSGYAEVEPGRAATNYTPIFYLTDVLDLMDSGWVLYDDGMNDKSKSLTWALFETKTDGIKFAVISTHYCYKSVDLGGNEARVKDARQMLDTIESIRKRYPGISVFAGGDLNCNSSTEPYGVLLNGGMTDVALVAEKRENVRSSHSYPTYNQTLGIYDSEVFPTGAHDKSIDHILLDGSNVELKLYDVVTDLYSLLSTDHCPVYTDFNFKK